MFASHTDRYRYEAASAQAYDDPPYWQGGYGSGSRSQYEQDQRSYRNYVDDEDASLPSVGSRGHADGTCRPCAWLWKPSGCRNAHLCTHCHLCTQDVVKQRKKRVPVQQQRSNRKQDWDWQEEEEEEWEETESLRQPPKPSLPPPVPPVDRSLRPGAAASSQGGSRLRVEEAPPPPAADPRQLRAVSRGSERHPANCRPCIFRLTQSGCKDGVDCLYCHICIPKKVPKSSRPEGERQQHPNPSMAAAGARTAENQKAQFIKLADRLQPEQPATSATAVVQRSAQLTPGTASSSVVLGTAPYPQQPQPPRTAVAWPAKRKEYKEIRVAQSPMPMGVLEADPCPDCDSTVYCVCLRGDLYFSEREPQQSPLLSAPAGSAHPVPPAHPISNGDAGTQPSGEVDPALQRSFRELFQSGEDALRSSSSAGPERRLSPGEIAHVSGNCTPCSEWTQSGRCSLGATCVLCHICVEPRKRKKIGNMALKKKSSDG